MERWQITHGRCQEILATYPDNHFSAVITDPPYGLKFMGKAWDAQVPDVETWQAVLRVLKPGGHLLCFAGTRTQHRMAVNIEDAGFEIRDMIAWVYGSGFPKSHNISKAIDKMAGQPQSTRYVPNNLNTTHGKGWGGGKTDTQTKPNTAGAKQWDGWGTALKPALEPITVARKPFASTVAANVVEHGTGGLNIDAARIPGNVPKPGGRWPANLIHDGHDEVMELFPDLGRAGVAGKNSGKNSWFGNGPGFLDSAQTYADAGSAARFFYCAKVAKKERTANGQVENKHPTVKPIALMRYLIKLVTPPGGVIVDPFCGSGSTLLAAVAEGVNSIGIDADESSVTIARERLAVALEALEG